ncbi:MAG TPA: oligopeptide/dipeptide ABC transporter ATP-binding protein [Candidatus Limnocylindrales bacterium]|jgi:oligopeptide transport system ATP-binding protein|nr:oligopeptide/dipeptide ABC transporter ATP-binding protein [Candidatus Limnocylindrales bacterium]
MTTTMELPHTAPSAGQPNLVEVEDLKVHFPIRSGIFQTEVGTVKAVDGITFQVRKGETLGLVGESGCGKSTTGRAMIRLREPTSGKVTFDGIDLATLKSEALRKMRRRMQIIFQDPYGSLDPRMTVGSIISEPIDTHRLAKGEARRERVADLLRIVGLDPKYVSRYPHEFSGGQRQRIGVARALAVEPEFIVCDEPISALDVSIQAQVLNLLTDLREQLGLTYLFIAHDLSVVKHISDRVAVMYLGKIVEIGPPEIMYAAPGHPYTRALLSAVPVPDPEMERKRKRVILTGDVPSPVNPPEGCRFHTRCWLYERLGKPEECRTVDPPIRILQGDHGAACHFAEQALASDVGVSHIDMSPVRRGTPEAALASIRPQDGGAQAEAQTVAIAETVIGGPPVHAADDADGTNGATPPAPTS